MKASARKTAERLGWAVHVESEAPGYEWVEFGKYTPAGQDFSFSLVVREDDTRNLCERIEIYLSDFDPDYEAIQWQKDGHGIKGAPYHLKDIVEDFERAQSMVQELLEELHEIEEGEE